MDISKYTEADEVFLSVGICGGIQVAEAMQASLEKRLKAGKEGIR